MEQNRYNTHRCITIKLQIVATKLVIKVCTHNLDVYLAKQVVHAREINGIAPNNSYLTS